MKELLLQIFLPNLSTRVLTKNDDGYVTTQGVLVDYIQMEIEHDSKTYFLLDGIWNLLQDDFDNSLSEKYRSRVSSKFRDHRFIREWREVNEEEYNSGYNDPPNSLYMHLLKVNYIELCDALVIDSQNKVTYIIHAKDSVGATIRDLTSQVRIAASIIEEEIQTNNYDSLIKLYCQASENGRIDATAMSQDFFLSCFIDFRREYVLVIHDKNKTFVNIREGNFDSRIAKFSLVDFVTRMNGDNWNCSICCA